MTRRIINIGQTANDRRGDPLRVSFNKINQNFEEVYNNIDAIEIPDVSDFITASDIPSIPLDISDLTDNEGLLNQTADPINVLPYLELTNNPFITQPVILGESVSITAEPAGNNARLDVIIGSGPVIDSVTVSQAGSNYVVGQRYRISSFNVGGGGNSNSNIDFEIETVDENGSILTITNIAFSGAEPVNAAGTYTNRSANYQPSVFDEIDTGVTLTRGRQGALFNIEEEQEYNRDTYVSPIGTLWNSDGWGDLLNLPTRSYTTLRSSLNNEVGENIINAELVMWDTINNKFYKFDFTEWGQSNDAGFAYTRNLVTDPNYFVKTDGGSEVDIFVEDDGDGAGIGITRANNQGIYNPYREGSWDSNVSPEGMLWNIDGWDDLTNIESRTYTNFKDAYNGQLGNRVPGSRAILYIPEINKYYAIQWLTWTQGGNGGGFSYIRKELDLTQLQDGVTFADGTKIRSTNDLVKPVRGRFPGSRRIEEAAGYKEVVLSELSFAIIEGATSRAITDSNILYIPRPSDIFNITNNWPNFVDNIDEFEFSLDGDTWYRWSGSAILPAGEYGYFLIDTVISYDQGDTVFLRYPTGGRPVEWWNKNELPGGGGNFRGAVIDYHAYDINRGTIIGTIHIVDDSGEGHVTHTEVSSGSSNLSNLDLWNVPSEGRLGVKNLDGAATTVKIQWIAKVFYGSEYYD